MHNDATMYSLLNFVTMYFVRKQSSSLNTKTRIHDKRQSLRNGKDDTAAFYQISCT